MTDSIDVDRTARPRARCRLVDLPQPLHVFAAVTRSRHFHLGCFDGQDGGLRRALDRLATRFVSFLPPGHAVLDVGCGLGGTSTLLAQRGFPVLGIDPCPVRIAFARRGTPARLPVHYARARLEDLAARRRPRRLRAVIAIEVLQHFPALDVLVDACRRLLAPGGVVCIQDLAAVPAYEWAKVPFHRHGAVAAAFARHGFRVLDASDTTGSVFPTFQQLADAIERERPRLARVFSRRLDLRAEIAELLAQIGFLGQAVAAGELRYESVVLQAAT